MKKLFTIICITVLIINSCSVNAQNIELLFVEQLEDNLTIIPEQCTPEHLVVVISSSIPDLKFESNQLPDDEIIITHLREMNQYIICHERMKFILTISGQNFQSADIPINDVDRSPTYRVSVNSAKGTVDIRTNPTDAMVIFPSLDNTMLSSNKPITNVPGIYNVIISKPNYRSVDTTIVIPRDSTNIYEIELIPLFSQVKINLETWDNTVIETAPIIWIDSVRVSLDAMVNPNVPRKKFYEGVEHYKLYENDIIPLPSGNHEIKIESDNYTPSYAKYIFLENGTVNELSVMLEPVYGYITFFDELNAEGAEVYVNGKLYGNIPIFKEKIKVGENKIKFIKPGFISEEEELTALIVKDETNQMYVRMEVSKKITFTSEPPKVQVYINGEHVGFTPMTKAMHAGHHEIQFKKSGYSSVKIIKFIEETSGDEETIHEILLRNYPLRIISEEDGLEIKLRPIDHKSIELERQYITPAEEVLVPYGRYELTTLENGKATFKGVTNHNESRNKNVVVPSYSRTSFQFITADFVNVENFEASFGRSVIFPNSGLSTSIINVQYNVFEINEKKYETITPFVFFLNWDWRMGGSIFNQLDVCVLGRVKWSPGLKITNFQLSDDYYDASMWSYFYGIEITSRINYFNLNIKIGKQIMKGEVSVWDTENEEYLTEGHPFKMDNFIISIGFTLNSKVFKNNNMLRLWKKPLAVKL